MSKPAQAAVGPAPADLEAQEVVIPYVAGRSVSGWLSRGTVGKGAVLLLHGVRADRRQMIGRARFLRLQGYSVLLIDLPAHGESIAAHITFGRNESVAVSAALAYLSRTLPGERIGVIGVSLGAASLVLAQPDPAPKVVVLESMYPTIREAVIDRLRLHAGAVAEPLAPLLLWQLPLRLGVSPEQLQPIVDLPALHAPLLIASGELDRHTTLPETQRLYAAANLPKALWIVQGAAHVDLHAYDPAAYEAKVLPFLARYLRPQN